MSAVKERPILFSAPMVRAILAGTKTQTRRVVKPQPNNDPAIHHPIRPYRTPAGDWNWVLSATGMGTGDPFPCPYGQPGDRLYVRETWRTYDVLDRLPPRDIVAGAGVQYEAGGTNLRSAPDRLHGMGKTRTAIHMPRWASRIDLEIIGVHVERLNDISEADAMAEGTPCYVCGGAMDGRSEKDCHCFHATAKPSDFRNLWDSINGEPKIERDADGNEIARHSFDWAANPWVWVVEFRRVTP